MIELSNSEKKPMSPIIHSRPTGAALLQRATKRFARTPAFVSDEKTITYGDIARLMGGAQKVFAAKGLQQGDCLGVLARNGAEAWILSQAAAAMGLVVTNLHPLGSLTDHLRHIKETGPRAVLIDGRGCAERGGEIVSAMGSECLVLAVGGDSFAPDILRDIEAAGECSPVDLTTPDMITAYVFTGGTTGKAKMLNIAHAQSARGLGAVLGNVELPVIPRLLAAGPISHVTGSLLMPTLIRGGTVRMLPGFDALRLIDSFERDRINCTLLVPTMIYMLLGLREMDKADFSSLELILYAGSAMSPTRLGEALDRIGPVFAQIYGQTECYPITYLPKADHDPSRPEILASCGHPVTEITVCLQDESGDTVAEGEAGEICVRAPYAFNGYLNDPEATAETLKGGWHHTGDIARADAEGRLYIVDRKRDMIVTGGFNVFPREVEDLIGTHPGVAQSAVVGVPDDKWGEAVRAYVVRKPEVQITEAEIIGIVRAAKGSVHAPKSVMFVEALPTTLVGKVDKKVLREQSWSKLGRNVN